MKKKYPIGVDDYKKMMDTNLYCVDKTEMIREIIDDGSEVLLFTRPRRFGKTLNMSMIYYYFNRSNESMAYLFQDKNIWKYGQEYTKYQGKYPVIYLTMKDWKPLDWEVGYKRIVSDIASLYGQFTYLMGSDVVTEVEKEVFKDICSEEASQVKFEVSLKFLSVLLEKYHHEKVMILIDEYDALLNEAYSRGYYRESAAFLRNFLSSALKNNGSLQKGLLTGIFKVAKESIFSDMNNLSPCSILNDQYSEYFGFTEDEVKQSLTYFGLEYMLNEISNWYNGYKFGFSQPVTIYNPWSVMMYLRGRKLQPYWVNTSGNVIVKDLAIYSASEIQYMIEDLMAGKVLYQKFVNEYMVYEDIKAGAENIWSFLLMSGYLKAENAMVDQDGITHCDLVIPNNEVKSFYRQMYKSWLRETLQEGTSDTMIRALLSKDIKTFYSMFRDVVLRTVSYNDVGRDNSENFYHAFTLGLLVNIDKEYVVKSNRESGFGRYDVMIIPNDKKKTGVIIEFKKIDEFENETLQKAVKSALDQIDEKQYEVEMKDFGITDILKMGIAFKGKDILIDTKCATTSVVRSK